jgi:hypothetical protein
VSGLTRPSDELAVGPDRTERNAERDDKWARRAAATARRDNGAHFEARALAWVRGSVQISDDALLSAGGLLMRHLSAT